jgi:hypothetical protein
MKESALLFTAALLLAAISTARADDAVQLSANATNIIGWARYSTNRVDWAALSVGTELSAGAKVQTGASHCTADLALTGPDAGGQAIVRVCTTSVLNLIRLISEKSGSVTVRHITLDLAAGQIRVSLDGASQYEFEVTGGKVPIHLKVSRSEGALQETAFVVGLPGTVTILKGAAKVRTGDGAEKSLCAGEQLRGSVGEVTKLPPESPELKVEP